MQKSLTDPAAEKQAIKTAPTMADLLAEFWEWELAGKKTGAEMRRLLEKDVLPAWGKRKVHDITRRDVVALLDTGSISRSRCVP